MNARVVTLGREARELTCEERFDLVDDILASLGDHTFPHDAAWVEEIADRIAADERDSSLRMAALSVRQALLFGRPK